jgi:hypothetical protein
MEMRRLVIAVVHLHNNTEEPADLLRLMRESSSRGPSASGERRSHNPPDPGL